MDLDTQLEMWMDVYADRLIRLGYIYIKDMPLSEDIVQEAFLKAYYFAQKNQIEKPYAWLVKVVINRCLDIQRKHHRHREVAADNLPEQQIKSTEDTYFRSADFEEIRQSIFSLPEKYRNPIILFYFEDMSVLDIANVLETNSGTIKTRLSRGRDRLRKILLAGDKDEHRREISECQTFLRTNSTTRQ